VKTVEALRERARGNVGRLIAQADSDANSLATADRAADLLSLPLRGRLGGGGEREIASEGLSTLPAPTQPPPAGEGQDGPGSPANRELLAALADCRDALDQIADQLNHPLKDRS